MEKTYEALIERLKQQYFNLCYNYGYVEAYNVNATDPDKDTRIHYAQGELSSYISLLEAEGICISEEQYEEYKEEGRQAYLEDNR